MTALSMNPINFKQPNKTNKKIPNTHFDYFHCHKWHKSIYYLKENPDFVFYWRGMIGKMQLISGLILSNVKNGHSEFEPTATEIEGINRLFKEDMDCLLKDQRLPIAMKDCIDARVEENFQIIRCALIMKNIMNKCGGSYLHEIINTIKTQFADAFIERMKNRNVRFGCMSADHYLGRKKHGQAFTSTFYNCPIFGTFKHMGLVELCRGFCFFCEAHGQKVIANRMPFRTHGYLAKSLSRYDDCCEFNIEPESIFLKFLIKILPDFCCKSKQL